MAITQRPANLATPPIPRPHCLPLQPPRKDPAPKRIASNFAFMSLAEILCRGLSVAVTLTLTHRLGKAGYGRIEFAFNVVFCLVLLVRDAFEVIISRELARHPRLIRPLVNHVLAIKGLLSCGLFVGLVSVGGLTLSASTDFGILSLYGLLLLTTALGLDFVFRGTERYGLVALSLCIRTLVYASGVWLMVGGAPQVVWVPAWLALGECCGITFIWVCYSRRYGLPRPVLSLRFLRVFFRRGRSVCLIQISQTIIGSSDLMVVGLLTSWSEVGRYGAPHRMIAAILTFGSIFQQVAFPTLARSWRQAPGQGRETLDMLVKVLMLAFIPVAVGGAVLSESLVRMLLPKEYEGAGLLLALGIWRAPLLPLAFLYQAALIAVNRESAGVRLLTTGAMGSAALAGLLCTSFGLPGASTAVLVVGLLLAASGYALLARVDRQPAWHHHLGRPLVASLAMALVCMFLNRWHVLAAVAGGAATYLGVLFALGGLRRDELRLILPKSSRATPPRPTPAAREMPCTVAAGDSGKAELAAEARSW
jgi:O-antigen/teichoic acid export membrane protein